jgi:MGT family glycosyltransferase
MLRRIIAALGTLPVRGIVTTGQGVDPSDLEPTPNVQVLRSAPHSRVLREASLVLTHCGHGTTARALAAGVPLVCLPQGRDQPDIAARVVHHGAGVRLDAAAPAEAIAAAARGVLADPRYRRAAGRIAQAVARETAIDRAVEHIEQVTAEVAVEA